MQSLISNLLVRLAAARDEEGQTAVEYGLVLALISLIVVGVLATGADTVIDTVVADILAAL